MKDGCQIIRSGLDIVMLVPLCKNLRPYSLTGPKALDPNHCIGRKGVGFLKWLDQLNGLTGPRLFSTVPSQVLIYLLFLLLEKLTNGSMVYVKVTEVAARLKDNGDVVLISGAVTNNNSSGKLSLKLL